MTHREPQRLPPYDDARESHPSADTPTPSSNDVELQSKIDKTLFSAPIALCHHTEDTIIMMNERAAAMFGFFGSRENVALAQVLHTRSMELFDYHLRRVANGNQPCTVELTLDATDSDTPTVVLAESSMLESGVYQTFMVDLTAQKRAEKDRAKFEERMRQSQKLEILYQLSGGIAHDFNNLLQVLEIQSSLAETLLLNSDHNRPLKNAIGQIAESVKRGSLLTQRLLAFSRKAPLEKVNVDLNEIVKHSVPMIRHAIGPNVDIGIETSDELLGVWVDPVQIEQLLLNLCINSRDAMNGHGRLILKTTSIQQESTSNISGLDLFVGPYAKLLISDNGSGISESVLGDIFEPFFTTKDVGKGTGLGLAIVHNVLRQHEGAIEVVETSDHGTTIAVYLPSFRLNSRLTSRKPHTNFAKLDIELDKIELALVVDDETEIRRGLKRALENSGVRVLTAANGEEAIQLIDEYPDIGLVLSDVVMPLKGGPEICEHYRLANSTGKIVLISGHGDSVLDQDFLKKFDITFIQKPFSFSDLVCRLQNEPKSIDLSRSG